MAGMVNRDVIGIVTKIDLADPRKAEEWLALAGCKRVFKVNSITREGVADLEKYLGWIDEKGDPVIEK